MLLSIRANNAASFTTDGLGFSFSRQSPCCYMGHRKSPNVSAAACDPWCHALVLRCRYHLCDGRSYLLSARLSYSLMRRITVTASQCLRLRLSLGGLSLSLESPVTSLASHPASGHSPSLSLLRAGCKNIT